ncbi:MAG: Uncharacterised protein [Flavobacteriaceae bacterium]|jgi:uncharacterized membrane protein YgdD (TMEM256/DUF423 family)|nr:DUF423 domain-containing protein [Flavobacteriaceae bacterium]CAI8219811.1 MAG: Uncharacterised protein [Flavobacteriaceae bacterium]
MRIKVSITLFLGMIAVVLGALGSHALKEVLTPEQLESFTIGVRYQMTHVLLLMVVLLTSYFEEGIKETSFWLTVVGILLFSGSIYLLNLQQLLGVKLSFLGPVTPIGGLFLITNWGFLALKALKR